MTLPSLRRRVLHSAGWTLSSQVLREVIQFGVSVVLARLLSPKDYGLVGMSAAVIGFTQIFNTIGFRSALIQKQDLDDSHYSTAFWTTVVMSSGLCVLLTIVAPLLARFFREPALDAIIRVSSLGMIVTSLTTVHYAILEKRMDFRRVVFVEAATALASGVVGIALAVSGYGVWSIVLGPLVGQATLLPVPWLMTGWRPRLVFRSTSFRDLFAFGAHLTGANVVNYFARNADNLIIGRFLGATSLGYYAMAYNLMLRPLSLVSGNIGRVLFPALSAMKSDQPRTRTAYLKMVQMISLVTFPMMVGLCFIAPELIRVVYGTKWLPVVPVLRILCLLGATQSIGTTVGTIYLSQGRTDLNLKYTLIFTPILMASFFAGIHWGIVGVAACYALTDCSLWIWSHMVANRLIGLRLSDVFSRLIPATAGALGMLAVLVLARLLLVQVAKASLGDLAYVLLCVVLGAATYGLLVWWRFRGRIMSAVRS